MTEELLREIERRTQLWREGWDCTDETTGRIKREDIPALVAEVRRLRAALEFYAEKANWRTTSEGFAAQYDRASPAAVKDGGIMARLALMSQQEGEKQ